MIQTKQVSADGSVLGDPLSEIWASVIPRKVALVPAPVAMQPSKYIQAKWKDGDFGKVNALGAQVLHNGSEIAIRLEWQNPAANTKITDNDDFTDGAAVLFPLTEHAPLFMGAPGEPVNIWHWRADWDGVARSNVADGIGKSQVVEEGSIITKSVYDSGHWAVVFRRLLSIDNQPEAAQFKLDETIKIAFCVWDGGNAERGGLKAFSPGWLEVRLQA